MQTTKKKIKHLGFLSFMTQDQFKANFNMFNKCIFQKLRIKYKFTEYKELWN